MSIATEVDRIKAAKSAIKSAINAKGGTLTDEQIDQYANAIASLPSGSSIDLTGVNVTADGLLEGVVAVNGAGQKVTGNIKTVLATLSANVVTVPKGYIADEQELKIPLAPINQGMSKDGNITIHTVSVDVGYVPSKYDWSFAEVDLSGVDATADKMLSGTVSLDASGEKITGNIPTVTASLENDVVTVPKGYIAEPQTFEVGSSGGSMDFYKCVTVYGPRKVECYVISGCPTAAVNGSYAKTEHTTTNGMENFPVYYSGTYYYYYNPTDMVWCIGDDYNSYNWLYYGEGSSWSDNNWDGVSGMLGVKDTITLDADAPKTWDGYKALLADGVYTFEKTLTTGLSYGDAFTPAVNKIYNADCSVAIASLNTSKPDDYVFFNALNSADGWDMVGAEIVQDGSRSVFSTNGGSDYAVITKNPGVPLQSSPRTMSHWFRSTGSNGSAWCGVGYGTSGGNSRYTWGLRDEYSIFTLWADDNFQSTSGRIEDDKWHHFVTTYDGTDKIVQYVDGKKIWEWSTGTTNTSWQYIHIGDPWESYACVGHYADLYIYDRVLTDTEIVKLFQARTVDGDQSSDDPGSGDSGSADVVNAYQISGATGGWSVVNGVYTLSELKTNSGCNVYHYLSDSNQTDMYLVKEVDGNWYHGWGVYEELVGGTINVCRSVDNGVTWMDCETSEPISGMTMTEVKGDDSGDSGSDGKTYLYTVSGAGTAGVDGDYYDTGETTKGPVGDDLGYHIYTNGTAKIEFMIDYSQWSISLDGSQKYYIVWDDDAMTTGTTTTVFGEDPAPTITKYSGGGSGGVVNTYRISGCPSPAYDGDYQLTEQTSTLCTMIYKKVGDTEKHLVKTTNGQWIVGFYDPEGGYDSDAYLGQYRINSDDPVNGVWFDDAMGDDCPGMSCTVIN